MQIFISHSSKDKWAARRIAKDIEELGHTVFLDEKQISTGESIDASIRSNLKTCGHFLILLSPASIKSEWVLLELGGAFALEKHIVPILLYVGANDIPKVINLKLARDINDIGLYYEELGGTPSPPKAAPAKVQVSKPKNISRKPLGIGDIVLIARNNPNLVIREGGLNVGWDDEMQPYLSRIASVVTVDQDGDCTLDLDEGNSIWAPEWLDLIKKFEHGGASQPATRTVSRLIRNQNPKSKSEGRSH